MKIIKNIFLIALFGLLSFNYLYLFYDCKIFLILLFLSLGVSISLGFLLLVKLILNSDL